MEIKQLSVFIENREGRLEEVMETLKKNEINIVSLSLADTTEYGMLRMLVSDPVKAKTVLKEAEFSAMLTEVLVVKIPNKVGMLHKLLQSLMDVNIEYMYAMSAGVDAAMILKLSDNEKAIHMLTDNGFALYTEEEAYYLSQKNIGSAAQGEQIQYL